MIGTNHRLIEPTYIAFVGLARRSPWHDQGRHQTARLEAEWVLKNVIDAVVATLD